MGLSLTNDLIINLAVASTCLASNYVTMYYLLLRNMDSNIYKLII